MIEPDLSVRVARVAQWFKASVTARPGVKHVTVVHRYGQARRIDGALQCNHFLTKRIDSTRVEVSPGPERWQ